MTTNHGYSFMPGGVFHSRIAHLIISQEVSLAEISFQFIILFFNGSVSLLAGPAMQLFKCPERHRWLVQFKVTFLLVRGMAGGTDASHRSWSKGSWVTARLSLRPKILSLNQRYMKLSGSKSNPGQSSPVSVNTERGSPKILKALMTNTDWVDLWVFFSGKTRLSCKFL